jgi:hypothetical protein
VQVEEEIYVAWLCVVELVVLLFHAMTLKVFEVAMRAVATLVLKVASVVMAAGHVMTA